MTFVEFAAVCARSERVFGQMRRPSPAPLDHFFTFQGHSDGAGYYEYAATSTSKFQPLTATGAAALASRMGNDVWVAKLEFADFMTIYGFDVTFGPDHRIQSISEIRSRAPHD